MKKKSGMDAIELLSDVLFEDTGGPVPSMKDWPNGQADVQVTAGAPQRKQESTAFTFFDLISFATPNKK